MMQYLLNTAFAANGTVYACDEETRNLLAEYRDTGNDYMLRVVFHAGIAAGRIKETDAETAYQEAREKYAAWVAARGPWNSPNPRPYHEYEAEHQAAHAAFCVWKAVKAAVPTGFCIYNTERFYQCCGAPYNEDYGGYCPTCS